MLLTYININYADIVTNEKLEKILELFLPKMPNFVLLYLPDDLEYFKKVDPNITSIEQCIKTEGENYVIPFINVNRQQYLKNLSKIYYEKMMFLIEY